MHHQLQVSELNTRMPMSDSLSTTLPATSTEPRLMFIAALAGLLRRAFRLPVVGRVLTVATLMAATHAPATARAEALASLEVSVLRPAQPRPSAPIVREIYDTYDVRGTSIPELRSGLRRHGIRMNDGKTYDALTSWDIRWEYDYDRPPGSCSVDNFRAFVNVTILYPRWVADENDDPVLLSDTWDAYLHSLIRHEQGHRDIAVATADGLIRAVTALPPAATCADLDRAVAALARSFMKRLNLDQQAYDAETGHGTMQGAVLP
jgi:predicted secreted Zn-dependent protease